jgi:hypothetical protein
MYPRSAPVVAQVVLGASNLVGGEIEVTSGGTRTVVGGGVVYVHQTAKKHNPKAEAKRRLLDDGKLALNLMLGDHRGAMARIRNAGGIKALVRGWTLDNKQDLHSRLNTLIDELRTMKNDLSHSIGSTGRQLDRKSKKQ